ncbi:MAG: hypothetical protein ABSB19_14325 [Methylomonas sp.]|jgi:hypothetical protein
MKLSLRSFIQSCPATFFLILFTVISGCNFVPDHQYIIVSGPLHVTANSTVVIKSPEAISTPYYVNSLCLLPSTPMNFLQKGFGILSPDGKELFSPKVVLRNDNNEEDLLEPNGYQGGADGVFICFTLKRINDHKIHHKYHSPYTTVEIITPYDLNLNKVTWFSGDK